MVREGRQPGAVGSAPAGDADRVSHGTTPTCPRCGYDVSGPMGTWETACPVHGLCTECGLEYRWVDVLRPERHEVAWLFEHVRRRLWWSFIVTSWRALRPWSFWARVQMHHRLVGRRLAWFAGLVLVGFYLVGAVLTAAAPFIQAEFIAPTPGNTVFFNVVPSSTEYHLMRAVMPYGWDGAFWEYGGYWSAYTTVAIGMTLITPFLFPIVRITLRRAKVRPMHIVRGGAYALAGSAVIVVLGWVVGFAFETGASSGVTLRDDRFWEVYWWYYERQPALWIWTAWLVLNWRMFCRRYLKLRHALWVALSLLVIAGMISMVVLSYWFEYDVFRWLPRDWLV